MLRLRLWLVLIIDAEFSLEDLTSAVEPLFPHFSFKFRCRDSFVKEVDDINLAICIVFRIYHKI